MDDPAGAHEIAPAAPRSAQPPFVHYLAAYLAQDAEEIAAYLKAVGGIAEVRLVDRDRAVTTIVMHGNEVICSPPNGETRRLTDLGRLPALVADTPRRSGGRDMDLDAMREAMEESTTARVIIGGRVTGYSGSKPGILQETLLALEKKHAVFPLGGFGGASRDAAIALGLLSRDDALDHEETGPGYNETIDAIARHARQFRESAQTAGAWSDLVVASKTEDPETASNHVIRVLMRRGNSPQTAD